MPRSSTKRQAITIKHGRDPEVQEVNISTRMREDSIPGLRSSQTTPVANASDLRAHKSKPKSMTTRSTMTNEDDYTVVHTNTPCTSPASSVKVDNTFADLDEGDNDVIEVGHKMVGWKVTPRVHFPPPNTINASSSLRTSNAHNRRMEPLPQDDYRDFIQDNTIEPPFVHRPDRTLVVHQTNPVPLEPISAWPGYGGNVYFQPMQIMSKSIRNRNFSPTCIGARSRSVTTSRIDFSSATPDAYSFSKLTLPSTSPSLTSTKRLLGRHSAVSGQSKHTTNKQREESSPTLQRRQMAHLDKRYVLGLPTNSTINEDWSWISGMESLGSLKIGNPAANVQRHSTNETFTRHLVVEKVPRNFVFHPNYQSSKQSGGPLQSSSLLLKHYSRTQGIPEWALKQFVDRYYSNNNDCSRLPLLPLRVKGKRVPKEVSHQKSRRRVKVAVM